MKYHDLPRPLRANHVDMHFHPNNQPQFCYRTDCKDTNKMARTTNLEPIQTFTLNSAEILMLVRTMAQDADGSTRTPSDKARYTKLLEALIGAVEIKIQYRPSYRSRVTA